MARGDAVAQNTLLERGSEADEIARPTAASVGRSVVTFLVGLGAVVAPLYGLSIVPNSA